MNGAINILNKTCIPVGKKSFFLCPCNVVILDFSVLCFEQFRRSCDFNHGVGRRIFVHDKMF